MRLDYPDRPGNDWLFRGMSQVVTQELLDAKGYHHGDWERPNDITELEAAALLRLCPADDDSETPLTKSWLIEQGGTPEDNHLKVTFYRGDSLPLGFWECDDGWKVHLLIAAYHSAQVVRGLKTRGDFRNIARVLQIPLTEGAAP